MQGSDAQLFKQLQQNLQDMQQFHQYCHYCIKILKHWESCLEIPADILCIIFLYDDLIWFLVKLFVCIFKSLVKTNSVLLDSHRLILVFLTIYRSEMISLN